MLDQYASMFTVIIEKSPGKYQTLQKFIAVIVYYRNVFPYRNKKLLVTGSK